MGNNWVKTVGVVNVAAGVQAKLYYGNAGLLYKTKQKPKSGVRYGLWLRAYITTQNLVSDFAEGVDDTPTSG